MEEKAKEIQKISRAGKKMLMVAYFFPPLGGAGSLRPLKLAKYLPENGWDPVVLTVRNPDWYYAKDTDLLRELPPRATVYRSKMLRSAWIFRLLNPLRTPGLDQWLSHFLLLPDQQSGWILPAYRAGLEILQKVPVKAIYSTSAPMSCHVIAYWLKKKTGLPWIADFRDEWFENPDFHYPTAFHRRAQFQIEKRMVQFADRIVTAAPGFCRMLAKHPGCGQKCSTIFMGFDPKDLGSRAKSFRSANNPRIFTIVFSGLFYSSFRPALVVSAVNNLIDKGVAAKDTIRLLFVGANRPAEIGAKDPYGICRFTGFVSHKKAMRHVLDGDALLLLLSRERGDYVVPSKTFEYIASGKPLIAAVPEKSTVASIVKETGTGTIVDFYDPDGIQKAIGELYERWRGKDVRFEPDAGKIAQYSLPHQTRKFVAVVESALSEKQSSSCGSESGATRAYPFLSVFSDHLNQ